MRIRSQSSLLHRERTTILPILALLLLILPHNIVASRFSSCPYYRTRQSCRDASCTWTNGECASPFSSEIYVGGIPPRQECFKSCQQTSDCCLGFICVPKTSVSSNKNGLEEKECIAPQLPPPTVRTCPEVGATPVSLQAGYHELAIQAQQLCTLTKITRNAIGDVTAIVPVARSYENHDWESAAGTFAAEAFQEDKIDCNSNVCSLVLPPLGGRESYRLTTYQYQLSKQEESARFLEMTTFGTRQSDLDSWEYANEAEWVKEQMELPLTSHREYWRERANPRWTFSQKAGRSDHPCDKNSRWRRFTFTRKDKIKGEGFASGFLYVHNTTYDAANDRPAGPYMLYIDGHPRTVVQDLRWRNDYVDERFPVWDESHAYEFCSSPDEFTGGRVFLRTKPYDGAPQGDCREIREDIGNPAINFTGFESYMGPYVFSLPNDGSLKLVDEWKDGGELKNDDRYYLSSGLTDDLCNIVPTQAEDFDKPIFGIHPSEGVLQWDPRLAFEENTLESPIADGGGTIEAETDGKTFCSNVPRTFQNFEQCVLSTEVTACGSASPAEDVTIELNSNNILQIHSLTGRYVYAIDGLKVKQDQFNYEIDHPCTPGFRSRWEREAGTTCGNPTPLRQETRKVIRRLIAVSNDSNPFIRDITFPATGSECDSRDTEVEIEIQVGTDCWKHVHPEHLGVFDMTQWTLPDSHPGNAAAEESETSHPIKKWLNSGLPILVYPSNHPVDGSLDHTMSRWDSNNQKFDYVGRFGDSISFRDLPSNLQADAVADYYGASVNPGTSGVIVCGSLGEVSNDETKGSVFDLASNIDRDTTYRSRLGRQREIVWTMIALYSQDQLRQRMAWALSQILVVAKPSIGWQSRDSEVFLSFYDIFVRNAFGNYLDILREISYNPLMAENLSYLNAKSSAYVWDQYMRVEFADENFAREIMQLFTTGLILLNMDGTPKLDRNKKTQKVYTNADIRSFARAWTGFTRQRERGNYEDVDDSNRLDPMKLVGPWRDRFPKTDLYGGYIGDGYPLCVDLPSKQFLRKGSKYRLLGSSSRSELMWDFPQITKRLVLNETSSSLFSILCDDGGNGCRFPNHVTLERNLECDNLECKVDTVRVIQVTSGIFYEYTRPPCVEHPFYDNAMKVNKVTQRKPPICGNPLLPVATSACCEEPDSWTEAISRNIYDAERMTFATQDLRCKALGRQSCEYDRVDKDAEYWENDVVYHWAVAPCKIQVKVNPEGEAAIVHDVSVKSDGKVAHVNDDTRNYFGVGWASGLYPRQTDDDCGLCQVIEEVNCLCDTSVEDTLVFSSDPDSAETILSSLRIGAPDPSSFDDGTFTSKSVNGFTVYMTGASYAVDTIFEVEDKVGRTHFLKNAESTVYLESDSTNFSFRNPVHFMSLIPPEGTIRDAMYETDATLEHYFYHDNTAPFLCTRFIQRFGISNASPRYVKSCAKAFRDGTYRSGDSTFGMGNYGDLAATVASIVLDREARSTVLDTDPAYGSVREPLLRVIGLMRSMEFQPKAGGQAGETPLVELTNMEEYIGQMAYEFESVFSFFLPEFQPDGPVLTATLVAPEAQMLDMPKTIDLINGLHALIKYGLQECYDENGMQFGFGHDSNSDGGLGRCVDNGRFNTATGMLTYQPKSSNAEEIVDQLSTLLTSGRLSRESRNIVVAAYNNAVNEQDEAAGVRIVQQLITTTPEYHTTNPVKLSGEPKQDLAPPPNSGRPYKAIVYLMLAGGCDSYNMLVPNECSATDGEVDAYTHYAETRNPAHLLKEDLLPIDGSGQVNCDTFGVHKELPIVQQLYNDDDLLFFANAGVLGKPTNRSNYGSDTPTQLFAHNSMQYATKAVDVFNKAAGVGVLGRLIDALGKTGLSTGSISLDKMSNALSGVSGVSATPYVVSQYGVRRFMPHNSRTMTREQMLTAIQDLNNATTADSGFMAQTFSASLAESLFQNKELDNALKNTEVSTDFGDTELGRKLEIVSKMIKTRHTRGSDIDFFYVDIGGFDSHAALEENLKLRFKEVNSALTGFVEEIKRKQDLWDNIVIVQTSEFARTLSPNSGAGTDHAWGGHYFMCGGSVKGGRILGEYPSDMSDTSELNVGRGRMIPTTSWDQIWPGIAQWTGITSRRDFDMICPNRKNFPWSFISADLFENGPPENIPAPLPEDTEAEPGKPSTNPPSTQETASPSTQSPTTEEPGSTEMTSRSERALNTRLTDGLLFSAFVLLLMNRIP